MIKDWFFSMSRTRNGATTCFGSSWFFPDDESHIHTVINNFGSVLTPLGFLFIYFYFLAFTLTARHRRFSTLILGSLTLYTAFVIVFAIIDSFWYEGHIFSLVSSQYFISTKPKISVNNIIFGFGLDHFRIAYFSEDDDDDEVVRFSYKFEFDIDDPKGHLRKVNVESLEKGLPNSVLVILDYLSTDEFDWGFQFTFAGYYAFIFVAVSGVVWFIGIFFFILTPRHGIKILIINGLLLLGASMIYRLNVPDFFPVVIEGRRMEFGFGRTYFIILSGAFLNLFLGLTALILLKFKICEDISTFLEINSRDNNFEKKAKTTLCQSSIQNSIKVDDDFGFDSPKSIQGTPIRPLKEPFAKITYDNEIVR